MARMKWDQIGERIFHTGVDHGVLYPQKEGAYPLGVAWSGLISVSENPSGAEDNPLYADNIKYLNLKSAEELGMTIECYTYPDEWKACNGESDLVDGVTLGQQRRNTFGFSYRTKKGNDTEGEDHGYIIHLVYGCSASPSEESHSTVNENPDAVTFSFEITTTGVAVSGKGEDEKPFKPVASIKIDSTKLSKEKMDQLESILYGSDTDDEDGTGSEGRLPLPDELKTILADG